jgi:DNA-3-methyladenine glycosylase I
MNMKQGRSWDMAHHPPMPRPQNDDGYFEEMSKMVFRAGLNWSVIEKKWPAIKHALANFSIDAVARFDDSDIERLLKDDGMIRSAKKISGVIANAQAMQQVQHEFGSFATYLQATKAKGEEALLKDLRHRFAFLGESTSVMFLFGVGEEMPQTLQNMQAMHGPTH